MFATRCALSEKLSGACQSYYLGSSETVYATRFFLLITLFVWRGCPLIKNRAEITGWHKLSQVINPVQELSENWYRQMHWPV